MLIAGGEIGLPSGAQECGRESGMDRAMIAALKMLGTFVDWLAWGFICTGLLLGLFLRMGERMRHAISWTRRHVPCAYRSHPHVATVLLSGILMGGTLATAAPVAAQGWWWGPPRNPGFDQNTVIRVTGRVTQVDLGPRGGPGTLRLETGQDTYTVMLGPGWYLADCLIDIRNGDPITVEGSKMMDPRGNLHLVAARVTNRRTGSVLELRDDMGRPRWMGGRPQGKGR
jgi:hypothetical protein